MENDNHPLTNDTYDWGDEKPQPKIQTISVKAMRALLDGLEDDDKLAFAYPSGDHWRTDLVSSIKQVEQTKVGWSDYHRCFKVLTEEDGKEANEKGEEIFLLTPGYGGS